MALLALQAMALAAPAAADGTQCQTPNVCATVLPDKEVYSVALYGATAPTRVTATGAIDVEAQVGHFVELELSVSGSPWAPVVSPTRIRLQTPAEIPFTVTLDVPPDAPDGPATFEVRAVDDDNLFPIDSTGSFQVAVFRGPLAVISAPTTEAPRPGGTAGWSLTLRNMAAFDIDYNPSFVLPAGFTAHVRAPTTQIVAPGSQAVVTLEVDVPAGAAPGDYAWSVRVDSQTHPELSVGLEQPFSVRPLPPSTAPAKDDVLARYWFAIGLGAAALGAVLFLSLTEVGFLALSFALLVPLFTRLKPDRVLDNFTRGQIYGYIRANPGAHYSELHHALELENGVLAYHLRVLMRGDYIVARNEGVYKRFYPRDYKVPKGRRILTRLQTDILAAVDAEPGITQRALARRLGESRQVVSYNVGVLREAGLLRGEGAGRGATILTSPEGTRAVEDARTRPVGADPAEP
jgi:predicted transcriptional regulator